MRAVLLLVAAAAAAAAIWFVVDKGDIGQEAGADLPIAERAARIEEALLAEPGAALSGREAYERLAEIMPSPLSLSIGRFEGEGAGVVAREVELTMAGAPDFVMAVDALRAYGLDADAVEALDGDRGASRLLAARLDLQGMRMTGLEDMMEGMVDGMLSGMGEAMGEEAAFKDEMPSIGAYTFETARITVDGLALHGGLAAIAEDAPLAVLRRFLQLSSAYSFDRAVALDTSGRVLMTDTMAAGEGDTAFDQDTEFSAAAVVYGRYDRGDVAFQLIRDTGFTQIMKAEDGPLPALGVVMNVDVYAVENLLLAEALRAVVAATWPDADETDFLSLGRWTVENLTYGTADEPVYTAERQVLDMTEFHGLMPVRITSETADAWHLDAFLRFVRSMGETPGAEGMSAEDLAEIDDLIALLEAEELSVLTMKNRTDYQWTPEDGAATLDVLHEIDGVTTVNLDLAGMLPGYDALSSIDSSSDEVEALVGEAFVSRSELDRFGLAITDDGGLDKALRVMIAYAEAMPDDEVGQLAILRGNEPSALRAMGAAGITMGGAQLAAQAPELGEFAKAAAAFVQSGGTLSLVVDPEPALNAANAQDVSAMAADPGRLVERLGLSLTQFSVDDDAAEGEAATAP